ncbi:type IV secretory system conjugative DNA transfer family protein [Ktedonospora formicarum]|uniref:Type IV secretion system coupling protein TraD DNA-binding domain-containing protein n=1 Tax=Ktedonospora formicarum TaxID=2778364 RepID=A0A8J3I858_9CHLR|nr:hypothetical protein [Ktedonospora formicarum]GHO48600.1 hypothetical protein KSX_67630 [Ktedonospora formicarum]
MMACSTQFQHWFSRLRQHRRRHCLSITPVPHFVARVIPARSTAMADISALETTMQSLLLDHETLALELASMPGEQEEHTQVHFLLRASSQHALDAALRQLQALYPQALFQQLKGEDDPLHLSEGEVVQAVELCSGGAAYEPLRSWQPRGRGTMMPDPLLGLLEAVRVHGKEQRGMRVVSQLTLLPLSPTWSRHYQRLAVEHPLEQEREERRREFLRSRRSVPSTEQLILLGVLVLVLVAWDQLHLQRLLPPWLLEALMALLRGEMPHLTAGQQALLVGGLLGTLMLLLLVARGIVALRDLLGWGTRYYDMRRIAEKINKSACYGRLRLYVIMPSETRSSPHVWTRHAHDQHNRLIAAYRQVQTATVYFVPRRLPRRWARRLLMHGRWQQRGLIFGWPGGTRPGHFLSGAEIATLWHLPAGEQLAEATTSEQRQERSLLVPRVLTHGPGWLLGRSTHAGMTLPVRFPPSELMKHKFVIGRTGKGKSTLFHHLALAHLHTSPFGQPGLCVIEPHGDLVKDLLSLLPPERTEDVILIDLAHQERPVGINPLDATQIASQEEADLVVSHLLTTFKGIWTGAWGPRVENVMRFSLKALIEANRTLVAEDPLDGLSQQYTLLDLTVLLNKQSFRHRLLDQVHDLHVLDWWHQYYERLDTKIQDEITTPVLTKVSAYASSPISRRILGQPVSTINFQQVVLKQQILLVNTASGQVGQDVSSLIGASLLGLFAAALSRQLAQPVHARSPFLVLVDEFRNYPINYSYILSELRKANTFLVLATQSLAQLDALDRLLRPTIFANVDQLFVFTLAGEDAYLLRHELGHLLTPEDVTALPDYTCYARWSLTGKRLPFFSLTLDLPPQGPVEQAERLREAGARRYGVPVTEVDATLETLMARHGTRPQAQNNALLLPTWSQEPEAMPQTGEKDETAAASAHPTPSTEAKPKRMRRRASREAEPPGTGEHRDAPEDHLS